MKMLSIFLLCLLGLINSECYKEIDNVNSSYDCTTRTITTEELASEYPGEDQTTSQYTCCLAKASGGVVKYCYPFYSSIINTLNDGLEEGNSVDCSGEGGPKNSSNSINFFKSSLFLIFIFLF